MMPSSAPTGARRRLRAPISGLLSADQVKAIMDRQLAMEAAEADAASNSQVALYEPRGLQAATTDAASTGQQPFDLEVPLVSSNTQAEGNTSSSKTGVIIGVIVAIVIVAAILMYCFCCKKRREEKRVEEHKVVTTSATQQQQAAYQDAPNNNGGNYSAPVVAY
jgi:Mid2 like cell wall stress sensor